MKRKHPRPPARDLPKVADFIRWVHSRMSSGPVDPLDALWFSRGDKGSLFLDREEGRAYAEIVEALVKDHAPKGDLSVRSVEVFLQEAMFEALNVGATNSTPFEDRLRSGLNKLFASLNTSPQMYRCWVPVAGLKLGKGAARFGDIRFVKFGARHVRKIKDGPTEHAVASATVVKRIRESETWGGVCAEVEVPARDHQAAEALAIRRTRQMLDVLNLFTDLVPYNYGWLYLPGEAAGVVRVLPMHRVGSGFLTASFTRLDPFGDVTWRSIRTEKRIRRPFMALDTLAKRSADPESCGALLLTAAEWAGRATVDQRREQSFLLYAIALESMILPGTDTHELGFRLKLRVAHLLGRTTATRARIAKEVARLYGIRSKIVHAGSYEVTDTDLGRMRYFAKATLFRLLQASKTHELARTDLAEWLDRKVLSNRA